MSVLCRIYHETDTYVPIAQIKSLTKPANNVRCITNKSRCIIALYGGKINMKEFNDVTDINQAIHNLTSVQIMKIINGLLIIMHEQGADAIDLDSPEWRLDKLRWDDEKDEIFLHFEEMKLPFVTVPNNKED